MLRALACFFYTILAAYLLAVGIQEYSPLLSALLNIKVHSIYWDVFLGGVTTTGFLIIAITEKMPRLARILVPAFFMYAAMFLANAIVFGMEIDEVKSVLIQAAYSSLLPGFAALLGTTLTAKTVGI